MAENLKLLHKAASENRKTVQFQLLYNKCCWLSVFINLHYVTRSTLVSTVSDKNRQPTRAPRLYKNACQKCLSVVSSLLVFIITRRSVHTVRTTLMSFPQISIFRFHIWVQCSSNNEITNVFKFCILLSQISAKFGSY